MIGRNNLSQFASRLVSYSSQYSETNWKASNLLGPPVSNGVYGDNVGAWCPSTSDQNQTLELAFETPVYVSGIKIYENYHGGAVTKIEALNGDSYVTLWSTASPNTITQYNIFQPSIAITNYKSSQIRLTVTQSPRNLFSEIEAVELVGSLLEIGTPDKSIEADIASLFESKLFADLQIVVDGSAPIQAHRNILAARAPLLYEFIEQRNRLLNDIKLDQFMLILEFVYTDELNQNLLKKIVDDEMQACGPDPTPDIASEADWAQAGKSWLLAINDITRVAALFKLKRLESLLVNYLTNKFLSLDNVFYILIDSREGKKPDELESASAKLNEKFQLKLVEDVCLEFTRINLKDASKHRLFTQLPRDVIIDIIRNLF